MSEVKVNLIEGLKVMPADDQDDDTPSTCTGKVAFYWKKFKIKEGLGHVGLLVFLGIYCGVGGLVSCGAHRIIDGANQS